MDPASYMKYLAALVFVLAMIGLLALLARRFGLSGDPVIAGGRRRLQVLERRSLDGRRQAVLLRRDQHVHLFVLGPQQCQLVESFDELPSAASDDVEPVA